MTARYSSLYDAIPTQGFSAGAVATANSYAYRGPTIESPGETIMISASYNLANGALNITSTDTLKLCEGIPSGAKLRRATISSGDDDVDSDNDFTFNLGWGSSTSAFAAASTVLQAGAETVWQAEELEEIAAAGENDFIILTAVAGETDSSGTIYFQFELSLAQ